MIKVQTNKKINLTQLDKELGGFGLCMNEENPEAVIVATAEGNSISEKELKDGIAAHIAIDLEAEKIQARKAILDKLGITEDEARILLS